jgi:hypothetical protein
MVMLSSIDQDIREMVARYVSGAVSLREFQEWFVPRIWNIDANGDAAGAQLANRIELLLAEYSNGDWTEEELRKKLTLYAQPLQEPLIVLREAPWLQRLTNSVVGTPPANVTKYIVAPPLYQGPRIEMSEHAR